MFEHILEQVMLKLEFYRDKKIVIFGAGKGGKILAYILKSLGVEPLYFVDNNLKIIDKIINIDIKKPEVLSNENKENLIIFIASMYYDDISLQLDEMGFEKNVNYYYVLPHEFKQNNTKEENIKEENLDNSLALQLPSNCIRGNSYFQEFGFSVGKYTYGYQQFFYKNVCLESIGAFCSIAPLVSIAQGNHPTEWISTHPFYYLDKLGKIYIERNRKVIIGNDVWIGTNVTILPSVKIGNGAVIGAGSVVTKDIPDYAIVVGVPARILRYRFSKEKIELLNRIRWWEWEDEKIKRNIKYFYKPEEFLNLFMT